MGFNFFKIVNLKDSFRKKLNGFVQNLGPAIRDGKTITFADNDISYLLKLQHDRIKDKDLSLISLTAERPSRLLPRIRGN